MLNSPDTLDEDPVFARRFGPFAFLPAQRLLLEDGKEVKIGARAIDILSTLIERSGQIITKAELMARAWPNTIVEDANLRVHIATLRRALRDGQTGARYIVNAVGRGYSFVAPVTTDAHQVTSLDINKPPAAHALPAALTRLIGREMDTDALTELVLTRRLITVVGAGGVGKSALALGVASRIAAQFEDGIHFVDLAAISDSVLIDIAFATAVGFISTHSPLPNWLAYLRNKRMLLVIDNCEHQIVAAATIVEDILKAAPGVHVLATSREPLGAEGEWQHRLSPLNMPPLFAATVAATKDYPAVQLFVEHAMRTARLFELADSNAEVIGHICRRLDGIPLAIELAAARAATLGMSELAALLDAEMLSVANSRRTAMPRHQTLYAAIDWSYDLLSQDEQTILRRLSVFKSFFTIDSAVIVAAQRDLDTFAIQKGLISIADKSLLTTDAAGTTVRHRLLHTTRAHAFEKLRASNDCDDILGSYADYVLRLLRRAMVDSANVRRLEWLRTYEYAIDDVRFAIEWAFSAQGNTRLGAELTVASVPFGYQLALVDEFRDRVEQALSAIAGAKPRMPLIESRLHSALGQLKKSTRNVTARREEFTFSAHVTPPKAIGVAKL